MKLTAALCALKIDIKTLPTIDGQVINFIKKYLSEDGPPDNFVGYINILIIIKKRTFYEQTLLKKYSYLFQSTDWEQVF